MILPRREILFGWGMANHARSWVYRPSNVDQVREAIRGANRRNVSVCHRGSGQSYGDAALNQGGAVVVTSGLDRILGYDPEEGRIRAEAGVTIEKLWQHVIGDGWWPRVVPGTSRPTLGGCLAMNVHGKNHVQAGSFAEHVRRIDVLAPDGEPTTVHSGDAAFVQYVGTQGLCGTILALELDLERVHSGFLAVEARSVNTLSEAMEGLRTLEREHDYTVGWIDCFALGGTRGRGELHGASYLPSAHDLSGDGLSVRAQEPPTRVFGVFPRRRVAPLLKALVNDFGIRAVNMTKHAHARLSHPSRYFESHAAFHFLLDYVPGWKNGYGTGGLIQYQFFVPGDKAEAVFDEALRRQHARNVVSYLGVLKRHRQDPFPSTYSVDGFSLALDFQVREETLPDLMGLLEDFDSLQREAGGRVYAAKDAVSGLGELPEERRIGYESNLTRRWHRGGG